MLVTTLSLRAQNGWVTTRSGDTLKGRIILEPRQQIDQVQIRGEKKITLTARQVKRIRVGTDNYLPVAYDGRIRLMKIRIEGYLSLLNFQTSYTSFTYDGSLLAKADGSMMEVPRINFRRDLPPFIDQVPLADSISNGLLNLANIESIVRRYNKNVEQLTRTTNYRNKSITTLTPARIALENLRSSAESASWPQKREALEIISDLNRKFSEGLPAPDYVLRALRETLSGQTELLPLLDELIRLLPAASETKSEKPN